MGPLSWFAAAVAAVVIARLVRRAALVWPVETAEGIAASLLAGLGATALDFGGWSVVDWRAGLFAFLCALFTIGMGRLMRLALYRS